MSHGRGTGDGTPGRASIWDYANPARFMSATERLLPAGSVIAGATLAVGVCWSFLFAPDDYQHGASVKIMFLHVPAALMAINGWLMMLAASLVWLVRRHHVSALAAKAAAPVGFTMTLIAVATGAIWGKPAWGAYWVWDPRLTSFLVLLTFYIAYMALWEAIERPDLAADLTSILCIVGSVFALLSRYAVLFWSQGLHQGASLSLDRESHVDNAYYIPLLICIAGFVLLFLVLVVLRTRSEIRLRQLAARVARENLA